MDIAKAIQQQDIQIDEKLKNALLEQVHNIEPQVELELNKFNKLISSKRSKRGKERTNRVVSKIASTVEERYKPHRYKNFNKTMMELAKGYSKYKKQFRDKLDSS